MERLKFIATACKKHTSETNADYRDAQKCLQANHGNRISQLRKAVATYSPNTQSRAKPETDLRASGALTFPENVKGVAFESEEIAMAPECEHLREPVHKVEPSGKGCKECLEMGDTWVHLRLCLTCGQVGCCDSSKNKHATKHFHKTRHAVMRSFEPGEHWRWCYVDEIMAD